MLRMDMRTREQYLRSLLGRYLKVRKRGKTALLDEYCRNTGMARKAALRKLAGLLRGDSPVRKRRSPRYGRPVRVALEALWEIFDRPCGQRLKPLVEEELDRLRTLGELDVDEKTTRLLRRVSPATIDRLLTKKKTEWIAQKRYGKVGGNLIAKKIPLKMTDWDLDQIGYLEMDLVLHCGATTAGEQEDLAFTRSRPYRKNDNAYIEQKNFTHVRRPLGYLRYDTPREMDLINDMYRNELRLYKNFFQPVMRLASKERVDGKPRRHYAKPKTPYRILRESGQISQETIKTLDDLYRSLNPADLKRQIDQKLKRLFTLYEKKRKGLVQVDPYKKLDPTSVSFLVMQ